MAAIAIRRGREKDTLNTPRVRNNIATTKIRHVYRRAEKGRQVKGDGRTGGLSDERVHRPSRPIAKRRLPQRKSSTANLRSQQSIPESASMWRLGKLPR